MPTTNRLVVPDVFCSTTPAVARMALVTGLDSTGSRCWSAEVCARLTTCVASGGLNTVAEKLTVAVLPGISVRLSTRFGGGWPATAALLLTSVKVTSSKNT